jgi:hypothetical protein
MKKLRWLALALLAGGSVADVTGPTTGTFPTNISAPTNGQCITYSSSQSVWINSSCGGTGTVTSVGLADGSTAPIFTISGTPVTASGTLTETLSTESANAIFAGPTSGGAAQPTFRSLVVADVPTLNQNTTGTASNLSGTPALPNGTTATTQTAGDTSTKIATDGFVSTIFAAPPAIGNTTPASGAFTSLSSQGNPVPQILVQSGIPFVLPSGGSIGNNGALTLTVGLPRNSISGYFYFPVNAIASGQAAGWYWTVMGASATTGTIYNSTYSSGQPQVGTTTAFSTTGPGAYTQTVGSYITALSISIPAGAMGINGQIQFSELLSFVNNADNKRFQLNFGGTALGAATFGANYGYGQIYTITNQGSASAQIASYSSITQAASSFNIATTVNTANAVTLTDTLQIATSASDYAIIESYSIQLLPHS